MKTPKEQIRRCIERMKTFVDHELFMPQLLLVETKLIERALEKMSPDDMAAYRVYMQELLAIEELEKSKQ